MNTSEINQNGQNHAHNGTSNENIIDHVQQIQEILANEDIIEVLFKGNRRGFYISTGFDDVQPDDKVVVEAENGIDLGTVTYIGASAKARVRCCHKARSIKFKFVRIADDTDLERYFINTAEEPQVVKKTRELVAHFNLDMKVTEAEWQLDRQRLTIYFTAPQRIDFRELVKELARIYKTRIELRQISTREETKRMGTGFGPCGLDLCCTSFLPDFNHITLEHARLQQLSNNVAKLSGYCGRLKCCLLYELDTYIEAFKNYPQLHSRIETEEGLAKLIKVDVFKHQSTLYFPDLGKYKTINYDELQNYMKNNKVLPPAEEDLRKLFSDDNIQVRRDIHGEEYIVD